MKKVDRQLNHGNEIPALSGYREASKLRFLLSLALLAVGCAKSGQTTRTEVQNISESAASSAEPTISVVTTGVEGPRADSIPIEIDEREVTEESPERIQVRLNQIAIIGSSLAEMLGRRIGRHRNIPGKPLIIGERSLRSTTVAYRAKRDKEKLAGRKACIIMVGGNDVVFSDDIPKIVKHIKTIVKVCKRKRVERIGVLTRFPYSPDHDRPHMKGRIMALRQQIIDEFASDPDVTVVDLFGRFADENGDLQAEYIDSRPLHPQKAYNDAIAFTFEQLGIELVY